jgi:hypothetical protein
MNKLITISFLFILLAFTCFAQKTKPTNALPKLNLEIDNLPAEINALIPEGYVPLDVSSGDLNLDSFPDVVLIVKKPNESDTSDVIDNPEKRPLLVILGDGNGKYKLAARNDNVVFCVNCGGVFGDPFEGVTIKRGYFSVEHYGGSNWRWTKIITFKYSKADNNWLLTRIGRDSFHTSDPNKSKSDIKTAKNFGKVLFERYNVYKD